MKKTIVSLCMLAIFAGFDAVFAASLTISAPFNFWTQPGIPGGTALIREYALAAGPEGSLPIDEIVLTGGIGTQEDGVGLSYAYEVPFILIVSNEVKPSHMSDGPVFFSDQYDAENSFHFSLARQLGPNESVIVRVYATVRSDVSYEIASAVNSDPDGVISSITVKSEGRILAAMAGDVQPASIVMPPITVGARLFIPDTVIISNGSPQNVELPIMIVDGTVYAAHLKFWGKNEDGPPVSITDSVDFIYNSRTELGSATNVIGDTLVVLVAGANSVGDSLGSLTVAIPEWATRSTINVKGWLYAVRGDSIEVDNSSSITIKSPVPPISVHIEPEVASMGDTITVIVSGGFKPYFVPSGTIFPAIYKTGEQIGENMFRLIPGNVANWPAGQTTAQVNIAVYDYDNHAAIASFMVKAKFGDVTANGQITGFDASKVLRHLVNIEPLANNYQFVVADIDRDRRIDVWDAINILRVTVGLRLLDYLLYISAKPSVDILLDAVSLLDLVDLPQEDKDLFLQVLEREMREVVAVLPREFQLGQNYPNPFNASTTIQYDVPTDGVVRIAIYDAIGRQVAVLANEPHTAGSYQIVWDAESVASGMYFCAMEAKGFRMVQKMVLLK